MEEVTRAIEISADISTLIPYLQEREFLQQWMHPLITFQVVADPEGVTLLRDQRVETLQRYWELVKTEFWVSERRQLFVIAFPPPAPHPTYLIELQSAAIGVVVLAKIYVPDTLSAARIEVQKTMMTSALAQLKGMVEGSPQSRRVW